MAGKIMSQMKIWKTLMKKLSWKSLRKRISLKKQSKKKVKINHSSLKKELSLANNHSISLTKITISESNVTMLYNIPCGKTQLWP